MNVQISLAKHIQSFNQSLVVLSYEEAEDQRIVHNLKAVLNRAMMDVLDGKSESLKYALVLIGKEEAFLQHPEPFREEWMETAKELAALV